MIRRQLFALVPGALVAVSAALALGIAPPSALTQIARAYPYVVFAVTTLFAWRLHRARLFAVSATLLVTHFILNAGVVAANALAVALLASFLPLGIALLSFAPDRGALRHFAILLAPLAIAAFFSAADPARTVELLRSNLPAAGVAVVIAIVGVARSRHAVEGGILWTTVTVAIALALAAGSSAHGIWMLAAGVIVGIALVEAAYALAYHDELTGLPSRRALNRALTELEAPYAIAIIDVDHFKNFNDQYGHDVGDQVLRMVAAKLARVVGGIAYRAGGEEFTIVFPGLTKRQAAEHVEAVRESVAGAAFVLRNYPRPQGKNASKGRGRETNSSRRLQVTVSAGVAASPGSGTISFEEVLTKADQAMYRAKNEGRNCVVA